MATSQQPPGTAPATPAEPCPTCGAAMAADQRYCLSCGNRRGAPRVATAPTGGRTAGAPGPGSEPGVSRAADVSPLAAVIGIALLGGMLLIGVLIGRGDTSNDPPPAPVVQVGDQTATTQASTTGGTGTAATTSTAVSSEWPDGTDGFTVQLSTLPKQGTTADQIATAKSAAKDAGVGDAAVLDSSLYPSLPPDMYVLYSGVYPQRRAAQKALSADGLLKSYPSAIVVEVSSKASAQPPTPESEIAPSPAAGAGSPASPSSK